MRLCGNRTDISMPKAADEHFEGNGNGNVESGLWKVLKETSSSVLASNSTS